MKDLVRAPLLNRRQLVVGATASAVGFPITACSAQSASGQFAPEAFGAVGDGKSDDYEAFVRLVQAVNASRGGSISLTAGRKYFFDRHVAAGNPVADLVFANCDGLTIDGNGASVSVKGDFRRDQTSTRGLAGFFFRDCRNVTIRNIELNGNVGQTARTRPLAEPPSHGLVFQSCFDVTIDRVFVHHFAADGLYIRDSKRPGPSGTRQASRRFAVRNSRFLFNARQALSVIQLRDGVFENCDFSYTGFVDAAGLSGPYGAHSPGAGVDVEPNSTPRLGERVDVLTGEILFRNCRMIGNYGAAFLAGKYAQGQAFLERVRLESCEMQCNEGESGGRDGFIFDVPGGEVANCTLRMVDKTAYLGWYPMSEANPRFTGNTVTGRNPKPHHPLFAVRPTRGAPTVEGNRFVGEHRQAKSASGSWLVQIDNPGATVRRNRVFVPAQAHPTYAAMIPAVLANARLMEANTYETDLDAGRGVFGILYGSGTMARNEQFRGTRPGPADSIVPVDAATGTARQHDTRQPWSRF